MHTAIWKSQTVKVMYFMIQTLQHSGKDKSMEMVKRSAVSRSWEERNEQAEQGGILEHMKYPVTL